MTLFCRSRVGDDQIATPDGPQVFVPILFCPLTFGSSATRYVLQTRSPVAASRATRLPRKVQHSNLGFVAASDSSLPETGTYSRPESSLAEPVITASGCSSARVFQRRAPVFASSAYTFPRRSPK